MSFFVGNIIKYVSVHHQQIPSNFTSCISCWYFITVNSSRTPFPLRPQLIFLLNSSYKIWESANLIVHGNGTARFTPHQLWHDVTMQVTGVQSLCTSFIQSHILLLVVGSLTKDNVSVLVICQCTFETCMSVGD